MRRCCPMRYLTGQAPQKTSLLLRSSGDGDHGQVPLPLSTNATYFFVIEPEALSVTPS
jgi:hypothetical protein